MNQKELLAISVTIFLTIIGWIVADLYHSYTTKQVTEIIPRFTKPIDVEVNKKVINILETRN